MLYISNVYKIQFAKTWSNEWINKLNIPVSYTHLSILKKIDGSSNLDIKKTFMKVNIKYIIYMIGDGCNFCKDSSLQKSCEK